MSKYDFHTREIDWALSVMSAPRYRMPNGRDSHEVAAETLHAADDALLSVGLRYTANGQRT